VTSAERVRVLREARVVSADATGAHGIAPAKLVLYPAADPATGTVRARLELQPAPDALYPGQFVTVVFSVGSRPGVLVPAASVVQRAEVTAVYVVRDGVPFLRQVRTGRLFGEQVEVLAGLAAGEQIAANPLAAAARLGPDDER
jgi:hypothetical protein